MIVKVLKHKTHKDTFGHIAHITKDIIHIWPTNVPELFPISASIETLIGVHKGRGGNWETEIKEFEMVDAELNVH